MGVDIGYRCKYEGRRVFLGDRFDLFFKPNGLWQIFDSQEGVIAKNNLTKGKALDLFSGWEWDKSWDEIVKEIRSGEVVLF